jgi:hypothetical protein
MMAAENIVCPKCGTILNRFCNQLPQDKKGDVITTKIKCEKKDGSGCKMPLRVDFIIVDNDGGYKFRVVKEDLDGNNNRL